MGEKVSTLVVGRKERQAMSTYIVPTEQRGCDLQELAHGQMAAGTHAIAASKRKIGLPHAGEAGLVLLSCLAIVGIAQPPLGAKGIDVVAKDVPVAGQHPLVHADDGAGRQDAAVGQGQAGSVLGHDALEDVADGRVHAHGFLDDGVEVDEVLGLGVGGREGGEVGGVEFGLEFGEGAGVAQEVVDDALLDDGGGVCAGEDLHIVL